MTLLNGLCIATCDLKGYGFSVLVIFILWILGFCTPVENPSEVKTNCKFEKFKAVEVKKYIYIISCLSRW